VYLHREFSHTYIIMIVHNLNDVVMVQTAGPAIIVLYKCMISRPPFNSIN
jgi:hypothetical protein